MTALTSALSIVMAVSCTPDTDAFLQRQRQTFSQVLEPDPEARLRMWAFQQQSDGSWVPQSNAVAHSFTSLGLHTEDDERIVVVGHHLLEIPSDADRAQGVAWTQELVFDGTSWASRIRQLEDRSLQGHTDVQWLDDELWFFHVRQAPSQDEVAGGPIDPVLEKGPHRIRSSPPTRTRFEREGVSDPSPVWFQDELHLFVTQVGRGGGVHHLVGNDMEQRRHFTGVTVPFATVVEGELWLLAQQLLQGRFLPVLARSSDGLTWTDWQPILDVDRKHMSGCTSPVLGSISGDRWLFCVEPRRNPTSSARPG